MTVSNASAIENLIREDYRYDGDNPGEPAAAVKRASRKSVKPQLPQAWRSVEEHLDRKRLRHRLKECYEED